jgi:zinc/manganese transport system permease protein
MTIPSLFILKKNGHLFFSKGGAVQMFNFLLYPFLACLLLVLIHTYFGIHILERGIIFVDLALAQFIGIGIAFSFLSGEEYGMLLALTFALIGAFILSLSKLVSHRVNIEAFIGILYIFSVSAAILILDRSPHGLEEFKTILNGNIIWVTPREVFTTFLVYGAVGLLHFILRKQFLALSYEKKGSAFLEFLFFASFAIVLVKSVIMAGVLQVFSFLVIPALIGRLYAVKPLIILAIGWIVGVLITIVGIAFSYRLDLPTAPMIVAGMALVFFALLSLKAVWQKREEI